MAADAAEKQKERLRDGERGAVLVTFAVFLPLAMAIAALVFDAGFAWGLKRHLQASADAAALAGAQDLPDPTAATAMANAYSASAGGKNHRSALPTVTTQVEILASNTKVKVTHTAESPTWFARLMGFNKVDVSAYAIASRTSTTSGSPLAIYVHELCGASTGNKGLIINGLDAHVTGGIHSNGHVEIGGLGFTVESKMTVYRPSPQGSSPQEPGQNHTETCKNDDVDPPDAGYSRYCTQCGTPPGSDEVTVPEHGTYRDWATNYARNGTAWTKLQRPCTIFPSDKVEIVTDGATIPSGVYCVPAGKEFIINADNVTGDITVYADKITIGGTGHTLKPFDSNHPILLYNTSSSDPITLNPSGAYNWDGYVINRFGGIIVNASNVTSPFEGLLEAEWVQVNGEDFEMLGTFPDTVGGTINLGVALEE